jgi:hypothetical protein
VKQSVTATNPSTSSSPQEIVALEIAEPVDTAAVTNSFTSMLALAITPASADPDGN